MVNLRLLNFDDLYVLRALLQGRALTAIAGELNLTQPAITQRLRKIELAFEIPLVKRSGRRIVLTSEGTAIAQSADAALAAMSGVGTNQLTQQKVVNLGTRPEAGRTWLWPSICKLKARRPELTIHLHFGSGSEILNLLGTGKLDVVLTSAPHMTRDYASIELDQESYVIVAHPKIARTIKKFADLKEHILIEHDRSFPFLRYVDPKQKIQMKYADVWFLESTVVMADALAQGLGVGIIPEYIARAYIKKKQLMQLDLPVKLDTDNFRLIYKIDRNIERELKDLASMMMTTGLTNE